MGKAIALAVAKIRVGLDASSVKQCLLPVSHVDTQLTAFFSLTRQEADTFYYMCAGRLPLSVCCDGELGRHVHKFTTRTVRGSYDLILKQTFMWYPC